MKRKVLILFPYLENYLNDKNRDDILHLRRELNLIVSRVSDTFRSLLYREINELKKTCDIGEYPDIELCISSIHDDDPTSGVRVCLTQYNDFKFYNEINFTRDSIKKKDVSHFVELEISDAQTRIKWEESIFEDSNKETLFDVKLKSNVENLFYALLSIMIDIYSYYIVGLYNDFEFRSDFSCLKIENIQTRNNSSEIRNTYGVSRKDDLSKLNYLPISLLFSPNNKCLKLKETVLKHFEIIQDHILDKNTIAIKDMKLFEITSSFHFTESQLNSVIESFDFINDKSVDFSEFDYIGFYFTQLSKSQIEQKFRILLSKHKKYIYKKGCVYFLCKNSISDNIPLFSDLYWFTLEENH